MLTGMTQPITAEPVTLEAATRTHAIATLHSVAQSFATAPTEPMPTDVDMVRFDLTYAQFNAFIETHAARVYFGNISWWATTPLATEELHGITVRLSVHIRREDMTDEARRAFETHNRECLTEDGA